MQNIGQALFWMLHLENLWGKTETLHHLPHLPLVRSQIRKAKEHGPSQRSNHSMLPVKLSVYLIAGKAGNWWRMEKFTFLSSPSVSKNLISA